MYNIVSLRSLSEPDKSRQERDKHGKRRWGCPPRPNRGDVLLLSLVGGVFEGEVAGARAGTGTKSGKKTLVTADQSAAKTRHRSNIGLAGVTREPPGHAEIMMFIL